MRRLLAAVATGVLAVTVGAAAPASGSAPAVADAAAVRIMPMGSSTTAGSIPGGYRSDLYQMLTSAGLSVDFVGAITDAGPAQLPDRDHEGHGGFVLSQLTEIATDRATRFQPDVVLLHAGANDVLGNVDLPNAPARLEQLIDTLLAVVPNAVIIVSTVGPMGDPATDARAKTFNAAIPFIVQKKVDEGKKVRFVDMRTTLLATDVAADKIHLTHSGNTKMAYRWYGALVSSPVIRYEAEHATFRNAQALTTTLASNNGKAGKIDLADSYAEFAVDAPYAGTWRLFVRGGNGTTTPCTHTMTVNGAQSRTVTYQRFGWEQWTVTAQTVTLNAGRNAVRFTKGTCFAEIDAIDLTRETTTWPPL
ncbi:GDSL-type esterase/lipase family protein [Tenggerimyces flavus]|uniref:GDSL-type esterase/lipase family protein n=1 Tax=Tenggerimyces flavus TaxID=1708749 RepID=A0ABV7YDK6_9ACTN|nr:GDSL-type esterase/lipase family protein [Tenggerimyces flavus]MBM7787813.1 lysophospholipase L1-like esterase [Tenggerimyces flavus]